MAQDVQEFNKVFIDKIESLMKVCGPLLCRSDGELVALSNNVYPRAHPLRVPFQNSFEER